MEIEELKTIWQQYDHKLNNLVKLNKKLVMESLLKKPQSKLNRMKFQSIYGIIVGPIVLIIVLHPFLKIDNLDWKLIVGCILSVAVLIFLAYINLSSFKALKEINLSEDPVIKSVSKVNDYKRIINRNPGYLWISSLMLFIGIILIAWRAFTFDTRTILYMAGLLVFTIAFGMKKRNIQQQKIAQLEKEILDLKEYEE